MDDRYSKIADQGPQATNQPSARGRPAMWLSKLPTGNLSRKEKPKSLLLGSELV